jgi:LCP family protein required for cell wall assembly
MLVFLALCLIPAFLCGICLVIYFVFPPQHLDVLVMGLDSRQSEGFASRTDSIMLLGIDPAQLRVSVLSIPRDLFIDVPDYGMQRINTVNVLGEQQVANYGPALLVSSIERNFGVKPERYVRLDFAAFVAIIDAVGGVTIDVERVLVDDAYPTEDGGVTTVRFESGVQNMDGERVLIYARTRHADDDYQRAKRQQQVLSALAAKLANPLVWPPVLSILGRSIDTDLTLIEMLTIMPPLVLNAGRFEQLVIDRDYISGTGDGYAVPNYALIAPWLDGRFD